MKTATLVPIRRPLVLVLAALAAVGLGLALIVPPARAANESATADLTLKPRSGDFYREALRPANLGLGVEITAPYPASPKVMPLKEATVDFPTDMKFVPKKNFPVCPDNRIGPPPVNLSVPPQTAIARCPKAVIGNGTAGLYLAQGNSPSGTTLNDPVLVIFNGGKTGSGLARIKIYGYSKGTTAGVYMSGVLQRNGTLDMNIPVLTSDSAVGKFQLNIPGTKPIVYDNKSVPGSVGLDKTYIQAKCSTGTWSLGADFVLGTRDDLGNPTSPNEYVSAPRSTDTCVGLAGRPALKWIQVKGPSRMRRGQKRMFRVRVTNRGTATMHRIKVVAGGRWIARKVRRTSSLAPGRTRWVKVPVRLTRKAKRHRKTVLTMRVSATHVKAKIGRKTIRVR